MENITRKKYRSS